MFHAHHRSGAGGHAGGGFETREQALLLQRQMLLQLSSELRQPGAACSHVAALRRLFGSKEKFVTMAMILAHYLQDICHVGLRLSI